MKKIIGTVTTKALIVSYYVQADDIVSKDRSLRYTLFP